MEKKKLTDRLAYPVLFLMYLSGAVFAVNLMLFMLGCLQFYWTPLLLFIGSLLFIIIMVLSSCTDIEEETIIPHNNGL